MLVFVYLLQDGIAFTPLVCYLATFALISFHVFRPKKKTKDVGNLRFWKKKPETPLCARAAGQCTKINSIATPRSACLRVSMITSTHLFTHTHTAGVSLYLTAMPENGCGNLLRLQDFLRKRDSLHGISKGHLLSQPFSWIRRVPLHGGVHRHFLHTRKLGAFRAATPRADLALSGFWDDL